MNQQTKNECQCNNTACGCGKARVDACPCGDNCNCSPGCDCDRSCSCATEKPAQ